MYVRSDYSIRELKSNSDRYLHRCLKKSRTGARNDVTRAKKKLRNIVLPSSRNIMKVGELSRMRCTKNVASISERVSVSRFLAL
jgi:hypothetical protein